MQLLNGDTVILSEFSLPFAKRKKNPFEKGAKGPFKICVTTPSSNKTHNIFSIVHKTRYTYESLVKKSKHLFRLQPVHDMSQTLLNYQLDVSPEGDGCSFTGVFGNYASFLEIKTPYKELIVTSKSIVSVTKLPTRWDLLHHPRTLPMIWMPWDRMMMHAYLQPPELDESELFVLSNYAMSFVQKNGYDILSALSDINKSIFKSYTYTPGSTTVYTTPYEVFASRRGVCQDFAGLFICLARLLDIPARYRMGYLYTGRKYKLGGATDATHAWVEVYLPYVGWVGFDPTNGCIVDKSYIRVSCGRYFNDATPTSGTIFQGGGKESLSTSVTVTRL